MFLEAPMASKFNLQNVGGSSPWAVFSPRVYNVKNRTEIAVINREKPQEFAALMRLLTALFRGNSTAQRSAGSEISPESGCFGTHDQYVGSPVTHGQLLEPRVQ